MRNSTIIRLRSIATSLLIGALFLAPAAASGQQDEAPAGSRQADSAATDQASDPARRLERLTRRIQELTGHFEQMRGAVEQSPELQEQRGWAGPRSLNWTVQLGGLVGAMTQQAEALARHLEEAPSAGDVSDLPDMQRRLERLRRRLGELTEALEGMTSELDGMRGTVHGKGQGH